MEWPARGTKHAFIMTKSVKIIGKTFWILIMTTISILFAYPFIYGLMGSLISKEEFGQMGSLVPLPKTDWTTIGYSIVFQMDGAIRPLLNSLMRTAWYTLVVTAISILLGYVLGRYEFKGKKFVIAFIIVTQVVPNVLTLIPSFVLVSRIPFAGGNNWMGVGGKGLINNPVMLFAPLRWDILVWTFLFMQAMKSLPIAFEEAAEIDGCSFWRTIFQVIIPLQLPIIAVIAINTALSTWNDWLTPFIYINNVQNTTLTAWLGTLTSSLQQFGDKDYPRVFALATISIIPPFVIFLSFQKYIIQGIAAAGIKG